MLKMDMKEYEEMYATTMTTQLLFLSAATITLMSSRGAAKSLISSKILSVAILALVLIFENATTF